MIYKFTYYVDGELKRKTCYTEKEALIFFQILISAKYPTRIDTIKKRGA